MIKSKKKRKKNNKWDWKSESNIQGWDKNEKDHWDDDNFHDPLSWYYYWGDTQKVDNDWYKHRWDYWDLTLTNLWDINDKWDVINSWNSDIINQWDIDWSWNKWQDVKNKGFVWPKPQPDDDWNWKINDKQLFNFKWWWNWQDDWQWNWGPWGGEDQSFDQPSPHDKDGGKNFFWWKIKIWDFNDWGTQVKMWWTNAKSYSNYNIPTFEVIQTFESDTAWLQAEIELSLETRKILTTLWYKIPNGTIKVSVAHLERVEELFSWLLTQYPMLVQNSFWAEINVNKLDLPFIKEFKLWFSKNYANKLDLRKIWGNENEDIHWWYTWWTKMQAILQMVFELNKYLRLDLMWWGEEIVNDSLYDSETERIMTEVRRWIFTAIIWSWKFSLDYYNNWLTERVGIWAEIPIDNFYKGLSLYVNTTNITNQDDSNRPWGLSIEGWFKYAFGGTWKKPKDFTNLFPKSSWDLDLSPVSWVGTNEIEAWKVVTQTVEKNIIDVPIIIPENGILAVSEDISWLSEITFWTSKTFWIQAIDTDGVTVTAFIDWKSVKVKRSWEQTYYIETPDDLWVWEHIIKFIAEWINPDGPDEIKELTKKTEVINSFSTLQVEWVTGDYIDNWEWYKFTWNTLEWAEWYEISTDWWSTWINVWNSTKYSISWDWTYTILVKWYKKWEKSIKSDTQTIKVDSNASAPTNLSFNSTTPDTNGKTYTWLILEPNVSLKWWTIISITSQNWWTITNISINSDGNIEVDYTTPNDWWDKLTINWKRYWKTFSVSKGFSLPN
jgi:hypothetical protein